jgi:phosphoribosylanthranilate isomerase
VRLFDSKRVGVKICGITNEADAVMCIEAGAGALGFNFYTGSKRFIEPDSSFDWIRPLEGTADRVAVVVNADADLLARIRDSACFEFIQFHGDELPAHCAASGFDAWIRAVRVKDSSALDAALAFSTPHLLLDAWSAAAYGGTGHVADWSLLSDFVRRYSSKNFVLAGGLTPENVTEAIRLVRPAAVDVAGGVESAPRRKDAVLVKEFINAAALGSLVVGDSP